MTMHPDTTHPREERFHDLVDGRLAGDDRAAIEAHLADCDACAARLARLRALLAAAAALPRELAPERDAWPGLRATLATRMTRVAPRTDADAGPQAGTHAGRARWLRVQWLRTSLAAAAVLLVVVAGWGALRRVTPHATAPAPAVAVTSPTVTSPAARSHLAVERDYARAAAELTAQLEATRSRLSPAAVATVERSLATIDSALAEARAALAADPANPDVAYFVTASYEQKLALLRRSTELTSGD